MSTIKVSCEQSPLAWPTSISMDELKVCKSCGILLSSPHPGSLKILTRRQGGVGDGVNIEESPLISVDYRGQIYSFEEAIFHTKGLHIFPTMKEVYPAEYHIHMHTDTAPRRYITIVIPVSHLIAGPGSNYFGAMRSQPTSTTKRPTIDTLFQSNTGSTIKILQYQGPDVRRRTLTTPVTACNANDEREFLLVLNVAHINAADLERIPREGSLSLNPDDQPAPGVVPKKTITRDQLVKVAVIADPGVLNKPVRAAASAAQPKTEMECKPVKVVNGRDVIDVSGATLDVYKLLGISGEAAPSDTIDGRSPQFFYMRLLLVFVCILGGFLFADMLMLQLWKIFFTDSARLQVWETLKIWCILAVSVVLTIFFDFFSFL